MRSRPVASPPARRHRGRRFQPRRRSRRAGPRRNWPRCVGLAVTADRAAGLAVGDLLDLREVAALRIACAPRGGSSRSPPVPRAVDSGGRRSPGARRHGRMVRIGPRRPRARGRRCVEFVWRDELVLGAVDEVHELGEPLGRAVVDEREVGPDVAQEQVPGRCRRGRPAAPAAQPPRPTRSGCGGRSCGSWRPAGGSRRWPDRRLDALAELPRGLDVVGQDKDLLGQRGPAWSRAASGRAQR